MQDLVSLSDCCAFYKKSDCILILKQEIGDNVQGTLL